MFFKLKSFVVFFKFLTCPLISRSFGNSLSLGSLHRILSEMKRSFKSSCLTVGDPYDLLCVSLC